MARFRFCKPLLIKNELAVSSNIGHENDNFVHWGPQDTVPRSLQDLVRRMSRK